MTTFSSLVGWDEAKCRPIYRHHQATTTLLLLEQQQPSFVDINILPHKVKKIAINTVIADSSTSHDVVPRRKRRDRAISNSSNRQQERVSLSPLYNLVTAAAFNDDDNVLAHANHATSQQHYPLFSNYHNNNKDNKDNNTKSHRVSYDAATRWTKTKRRYGTNKKLGILNNSNMSHTSQQIVDDVLFDTIDSIAIIPSTAAVNCNDRIMMIEVEEGGEQYLVFNENNDRQEGRSTIDESSRSATSSSLLHGNRDRVGDCYDRHRRRNISHNIQRIHQEIDTLVDHPLLVEYQCELDHPELDVITYSNNNVKIPEIVQHTDELVITTPSSKQRGEEQQQLNSFSNEYKSEEDDERYELDEYDIPSIFNPTIEDSYLIQGDENILLQLINTTILSQDDDNTAGFDKHFAIDETGSTSRIQRRRGSTYGDGKPVWTSSKPISSVSLNGPRSKIIVGWDDDKGRPIYRITSCKLNSLSNNHDEDPCPLPSTRPLEKSEIGSIPKQRKQKKKVYSTLFKRTGLSQAVRDEMDIDQPPLSPLLHDPPPPPSACCTTIVTNLNIIQTIDVGFAPHTTS